MRIQDVTLHASDGSTMPAQLALCEECNGETFNVLHIEGSTHLQCVRCATLFCDPNNACALHASPRPHDDA